MAQASAPDDSATQTALQLADDYKKITSDMGITRTLLLNGTFAVDILNQQPPLDTPTQEEVEQQPDRRVWAMPPIYMEVSSDGGHWIQALSHDEPTEAERTAVQFDKPFLTGNWDGERWLERSPRTERGPAARFEKTPPHGGEEDCLPYFNHTTGPGMISGWSIPTLLERAAESDKPITIERFNHGELGPAITLRFEHPMGDTNGIELTFLLEPHVRLQSAIYDFYRYEGEESARTRIHSVRLHYHVGEWMTFGDYLLPRIAYRDGYKYAMENRAAKNLPANGTRTIIKRFDITPIDAQQYEERIPTVQQGDHVRDEQRDS
ncbi:MAG: hypothetical protein ACR2GY_00445 [Phycisphaerales bacterium]